MTGESYCAQSACAVSTWYRDGDGDGHGNDSDTVLSCAQPPGYVAASGDCRDDLASDWSALGNGCGSGVGPLGFDSSGNEVIGAVCP